ncbi:MAG: outer membrane porin, OprD family [Saprospiraceae bacterium]|nr:outer membrane porin, OprD family [Saprospiraceae bacterium]
MKLHIVSLVFILSIILPYAARGQHQELQEKPKIWQSETNKTISDSMTILGAFTKGTVHGHFRYFFSGTDNTGDLSDYCANAVGGGIRFETANFKGFAMGVSGFYIFNAGSSDLLKKDESTGQSNRYELGLFDMDNPTKVGEINRVEEFFIKYQHRYFKATFGRQLLNTPFINLQDGRMRPTAASGLWLEFRTKSQHLIQSGLIMGVAPRSTSKWYDTDQSIGVFPAGVDASGNRSLYAGNVNTKGALLFNYQWQHKQSFNLQFWNIYLDNIFNTSLIQLELEKPLANGKYYLGTQSAIQVKVGNGGNSNPNLAYNTNTNNVWIFGGRVGWKNSKWDHSVNFNHITDSGRYLMPREWGRDYFYTFMPRERNEGYGDATALVLKSTYKVSQSTTSTIMLGNVHLPDVKDFYLNKYGMPSYTQMNMDVRHKFGGWLQGLEAQLLYVRKWNQGETYGNSRYVIHKVDMNLVNVVLNFRF